MRLDSHGAEYRDTLSGKDRRAGTTHPCNDGFANRVKGDIFSPPPLLLRFSISAGLPQAFPSLSPPHTDGLLAQLQPHAEVVQTSVDGEAEATDMRAAGGLLRAGDEYAGEEPDA